VPVVVSVIAHVGVESFPTIVIRHQRVTFCIISAAVY
jgi:hypothetical protein